MDRKSVNLRCLIYLISIFLPLTLMFYSEAAQPSIDSIAPREGSNTSPTEIIIHGAGFDSQTKVLISLSYVAFQEKHETRYINNINNKIKRLDT